MSKNAFIERKNICVYYQARIQKKYVWFVIAGLKGFEYISFDRTIDVQKSILEFFVVPELESVFLDIMVYFQKKNIVLELQKLENRLFMKHTL